MQHCGRIRHAIELNALRGFYLYIAAFASPHYMLWRV